MKTLAFYFSDKDAQIPGRWLDANRGVMMFAGPETGPGKILPCLLS
jgi:hypothetical protein